MFSKTLNALETIYFAFVSPKEAGISKREVEIIKQRTDKEYSLVSPDSNPRINSDFKALSHKAGLSHPPKLIIYEANAPQCTCLHTGAIILSSGMVSLMNREELNFLLGHEITHFLHRKTGIFSSLLESLIPLGAGITTAYNSTKFGINKNNSIKGITALTAITYLAYKVTDKILQFPLAALDRILELDADRGGLILTNDFEAAKSALIKLENFYKKDTEELPKSKTDKLLQTHPNEKRRISYLEKINNQSESQKLENISPSRFG